MKVLARTHDTLVVGDRSPLRPMLLSLGFAAAIFAVFWKYSSANELVCVGSGEEYRCESRRLGLLSTQTTPVPLAEVGQPVVIAGRDRCLIRVRLPRSPALAVYEATGTGCDTTAAQLADAVARRGPVSLHLDETPGWIWSVVPILALCLLLVLLFIPWSRVTLDRHAGRVEIVRRRPLLRPARHQIPLESVTGFEMRVGADAELRPYLILREQDAIPLVASAGHRDGEAVLASLREWLAGVPSSLR